MDIRKVLVISPHTDDGELGAGGTITRWQEDGKEIHYLVFSGCELSIPNNLPKNTLRKECLNSTHILGIYPERVHILNFEVRSFPENRQKILDVIIEYKKIINPDTVLIPCSQDVHQDHQTIHSETIRAFKKDASIWCYEHPWNQMIFTANVFVRLNEDQVTNKVRALKQYDSQKDKNYFDERNIRAWVASRGAMIDAPYAESFEIVRMQL